MEHVVDYLEKNWPERVVRNFAEKLERKIEMIRAYPEICKSSEKYFGARECLLTKHNTLYYTIRKEDIYVLTLWDNRQDPKLLNQLRQKDQ